MKVFQPRGDSKTWDEGGHTQKERKRERLLTGQDIGLESSPPHPPPPQACVFWAYCLKSLLWIVYHASYCIITAAGFCRIISSIILFLYTFPCSFHRSISHTYLPLCLIKKRLYSCGIHGRVWFTENACFIEYGNYNIKWTEPLKNYLNKNNGTSVVLL